MSWTDWIKRAVIPGRAVTDAAGWLGGGLDRTNNEFRQVDPNNLVGNQAGMASRFAGVGESGYERRGQAIDQLGNQLGQLASGQQSLSAEQLRQGLQQNLAAQRSLAAGASPVNQAMAARTAMIQAGRLGSGMAGQQALAGIQERQAAQQALGQLLMGARGQDLNAALQSRQSALGGYGSLEQLRADRFRTQAGVPTQLESLIGAGQGVAQYAALSDERSKEDIVPADEEATRFLDGLKAYRFRYRDQRHGQGEQLGILAQELERTPHGRQAIIETGEGKAVHGAKLATALAAATGALHRRVRALEGRRG